MLKKVIVHIEWYKGYWYANFPLIQGCYTAAKSIKELRNNVKEVVSFHLEDNPLNENDNLHIINKESNKLYITMFVNVPTK